MDVEGLKVILEEYAQGATDKLVVSMFDLAKFLGENVLDVMDKFADKINF